MRHKTTRKIAAASAGARAAHAGMLGGLGFKALILIAVLFAVGVAAVYSVDPASGKALIALISGGSVFFATTLAANKNRSFRVTDDGFFNSLGVIASDIIYEGSVVGNNGAGYARPLVAGDEFEGFAYDKADNASGSAGDINIKVRTKGLTDIALTGVAITDVGASVYASDDNAFTFIGTSNTYVGKVYKFVSSGVAVLEFDTNAADPLAGLLFETLSADKTLDVQDVGKAFFIDTDAKTVTLPATVIGYGPITFINAGAFGTVALNISPNAADKIMGADIAGANDKDFINTKATANRGDRCTINADGVDGWYLNDIVGTWATEA